MKFLKYLLFCVIAKLMLANFAFGQTGEIVVEFSEKQNTLPAIINRIEKENGLIIYHKQEWVENITVPTSLSGLKIDKFFEKSLENLGLYFVVFKNDIYLSKKPINLSVENAIVYYSENDQSSKDEDNNEGLKALLENVVIGKKNSSKKRSAGVQGRITDVESGEPLIGASVYIDELKTGTVSDVNGNYMLHLNKGSYTFTFRLVGKEPVQKKVTIHSDGRLDIELKESLVALDEIIVKEDKYNNTKGLQSGFEQITMKEIKELPPVAGERDILKASLLLPGVQTVGESAAGYNIRGGGADENLFLINNVPIYNTSHMFGFFSAFNPYVIRNFNLFKSNIPVEYGGRLSSVFDVQTKNGNNKKFSLKGGVSPITANILVEGPVIKEKLSYLAAFRTSYSNWILRRIEDPSIRNSSVDFKDLVTNINYSVNEKNNIGLFFYGSSDDFKIPVNARNVDPETEVPYIAYNYSNIGGSFSWQHFFGNKLYSNLSLILSSYNLDITDKQIASNSFISKHNLQHYEINQKFSYSPNSKHELKFGLSSILYKINPAEYLPASVESDYNSIDIEDESALETSVYIGDKYDINPKLGIDAGIRYSFYNYLGPRTVYEYLDDSKPSFSTIADTVSYNPLESIKMYSGLDFRFSGRYLINEGSSIKFGYSRLKQYMFLMTNTVAISPTDKWKLCDAFIPPSVGNQYNFGYYKNIRNSNLEVSAEFYYKTSTNLKEFRNGAEPELSQNIEQDVITGVGRSYGVELMMKKTFGKFNGWINYTYSRSELKFTGKSKLDEINDGKFYPSNTDKPHNVNFTMNIKANRRLSLSGNLTYSTGRPTTFPVSKSYLGTIPVINYSDRNQARLPDYFRIDIAVNLEGNLKRNKIVHSYWTFGVYNLTGRQNAYSVFFTNENNQLKGHKISIFAKPVFTITYNFKLGNYSSK